MNTNNIVTKHIFSNRRKHSKYDRTERLEHSASESKCVETLNQSIARYQHDNQHLPMLVYYSKKELISYAQICH
jgi:hypothetical protein